LLQGYSKGYFLFIKTQNMNPFLNLKWLSRLTTTQIQPSNFLRFLGFIVCFNMAYSPTFGQASQGFEGITTALNCGNSTCPYTDPRSAAMQHFLVDDDGIPVTGTGAAGVLGFLTEFTPSRTGTSGAAGLTEGDAFGVAGPLQVSSELGGTAPEGSQIFLMEDTDGWVTMYFDYVDLTGTTSPMMSFQYHLESTSWEVSDGQNDRFYARVEIDMCASATTITLLDTDGGGSGGNSGGDIDALGIENSWNTLSANLTSYVGCRAQLIIEFDSNSASEELGIDDISFTEGTRQPFTGPCTDAAPPMITCPGTQTRNVDASCNYTVEDFTGLATATDDCGPITITQSPTAGGTLSTLGNTSVTLTATDDASNTDQCTFTLTLQDVVPPSITCPGTQIQFLDANCQISTADYTSLAIVSDNCDASPTVTQSPSPGMAFAGVGGLFATLIATDASGNSSSCIFVVQFEDNTPPSITCPGTQTVPLDANCLSSHNDYIGLASVSDNCDASPVVTQSPPDGTLITANTSATLIVTDASGNSTSCTFMVMVSDNNAPSLTCPGTQTETANANCEVTLSDYTGLATASDNCAGLSISQSPTPGTTINGNTNVTLTATDASGNSTTCTFMVLVDDTTAPSITCPGTQTQFLDANCQVSLLDYTSLATVSDNCDASPTVTQIPTPGTAFSGPGALFATLTVTDASGNSTSCIFPVAFVDNTPPSLTCPGTQTEPGDANCEATLSDYTGLATASDNCDASPTVTQSPTAGTTINANTTVTLTATDFSGNSTTCTFMVEVQDNTPPTAMCVGGGMMVDQTNNLTYSGASAVMGGSWQSAQSLTVGTTGPLSKVRVQLRPNGALGAMTLKVLAGNTPNAPQTVLATKTISATNNNPMFELDSPVNVTAGQQITLLFSSPSNNNIVCVSGDSYTGGERWFSNNSGASYNGPFTHDLDFTTYIGSGNGTEVCLDASGNATLNAAILNDGSFDNCGPVTFTASPTMFSCSDLGSQSVTLVVTDQAGLSSSCMTTVDVKDKLAPTAVCTDVTVNIQPDMTATVMASQIAGGSFDNCSGVNLNLHAGQTAYDCDDVGMSFPVTVAISDASGNSTSCTRNVTVTDPNSNCCAPADAVCMNTTVQLDASGNATITAADVDGGSTTECGLASMTVSPNNFTCADVGSMNMVTLTVTDVNGDSDACTATVTVEDNVAPDAQCKNITVQLDASGMVSVAATDVDNGSSDACGIASTLLNGFTSITLGCIHVNQTNTTTLVVTDVNGNSASCQTTITVEDNVAPNAQCQNTTVQLDASGNGSITAADVDGGSTDACGIADLSVSPSTFGCADVGNGNTVTLTVTDVNGNTDQCTATVTVEDNVAPNAQCMNTSVQLDANGNGSITAADVDGGSTDACGIAGLSVSPSSFNCGDLGPNTVTLTATDVNGNTDQCTATVNVQDVTPPSPVCLNPTVYLQPDGTYTLQDVDVLDFANTTDNCNFFVSNISPAVVDCDDFNTTVPATVTVSDDSGNSAQCTANVFVLKGDALPAGWDHDDVGGATGDAGFDPCEEKFTVESNGYTHPLSDKVHYAYQNICGNTEIIAHVVSVTAPGFAGIMIRETLDGGSRKVALRTQLQPFVHRDVRSVPNGYQQTQQLFRPQHTWLRIVRTGNMFMGYTSTNGMSWQFAFFTNVNMNSCVKVGLFAEGPIDNTISVACFDNVSITGNANGGMLTEQGTNWETNTTRAVDFKVFPNPANNEVNVDLTQFEEETFTLQVFNNLGQVVYRKEFLYLEEYIEKLDLTQYGSGMYLINIQTQDGSQYNKKLIVDKK
jgi:hypothetical protein